MKKRPRRKSQKPPPAGARSRLAGRSLAVGQGRRPRAPSAASLQYKVIELSTVDEGALERALNTWTREGWNLDGVQFAMRESSKRPAMAFVFFTRESEGAVERDSGEAQLHLARLAATEPFASAAPVSAWDRLAQLAEDDEESP